MTCKVLHGDCLEILPTLESGSVDAIITDPPYPCIDRPYGRWTEEEWWALIVEGVIPEVRRVLKPTGSAVFILQPNSRKVGSMRGWLWEFMAWCCREWNMVQDAWWWNNKAMPTGGATTADLLRASAKACVWLGSSQCYRDQQSVLWSESEENKSRRLAGRCGNYTFPSGHSTDYKRIGAAAVERGGVTPFNVIPLPGVDEEQSRSAGSHSGMTPLTLARWWTRYICPPSGTVLDPFLGSGTMSLAAHKEGRSSIGIEREAEYVEIARKRIAAAQAEYPLFAGGSPC